MVPEFSLFTIETNLTFPRVAFTDSVLLSEVLSHYNCIGLMKAFKIEKKNRSSELFELQLPQGHFILRSLPEDQKNLAEVHCEIASNLDYRGIIRPLRNKDRHFLSVIGNRAYMLYPMAPGKIFDGQAQELSLILSSTLIFQQALETYGRTHDFLTTKCGVWGREPGTQALCDFLQSFFIDDFLFQKRGLFQVLGPCTINYLKQNLTPFQEIGPKLRDYRLGDFTLAHNDIQNTNVVLNPSGVTFLDLEDLTFAPKDVAWSHGFFRLIRHSIYRGQITMPAGRELLAKYTKDKQLAIAYRILSDIELIVRLSLEHNDAHFLYDLEKKIHHFYELNVLAPF